MKKILYSSLIFTSILFGSEESFLDGASKYWELTKEVSKKAWDDSDGTRDAIMKNANIVWEKTKVYSKKAKTVAMEQTLQNSLNLMLNTKDIVILDLTIDEDHNDKILMNIKLNGEDHNMTMKIDSFDWGKSKDKKYILIENIKFDIDIPWIDYLFRYYISANNGYIRLPYSLGRESLLFTIKSATKTKYIDDKSLVSKKWDEKKLKLNSLFASSDKKDLTKVIGEIFDKEFIDVTKFVVDNKNIYIQMKQKGSSKDLILDIEHFEWGYSKDKKIIVIKNIYIVNSSKPWVESFLTKTSSELHFRYTKIMADMLSNIQPRTYFKR